jgi:hypothetical protein
MILPAGDDWMAISGPPVAFLVHGTIEGFGYPPNPHAWVEFDEGSVWEPITEQIFTPDGWEAFAHPQVEVRYTKAEARERAMFTGHWGPWGT